MLLPLHTKYILNVEVTMEILKGREILCQLPLTKFEKGTYLGGDMT